ncbi:MAG TPA: hypothetical protein VGQ37_23240 [Vicinamibacterales bacterium]|nr:hypothetical protein [Vicinamibacterales bacterium]
MTDAVPPGSRASPPRDFTEFLIELSVALHRHAMYPEGHPSLGPAAEAVTRHAERLMGDRDLIAFGVARHQLIIEGVATDGQQPVLRRLAEGLHRHHLGAVSLLRGLQPAEVALALRALSGEPDRDGPLPLTGGQLPGCDHVRLHLLTFDGLTIVGDESRDGEEGASHSSHISDLWIGLARAALAGEAEDSGDSAGADGVRRAPAEPSRVADAIDRHRGAEAYDQVVVGYLLQIASELKTATGGEAAALRSRSARLISALKPETLRRLVQMGGDNARRNAFVHDAAEGMAVDAVVDLVKAAADASGQTISHGLVRMLTKMSAHAEAGADTAKAGADSALREQVHSLLSEWELADPNPEDYRRMLEYLATSSVQADGRGTAADDMKALRLVQMSLEVGTTGPIVDRAINTCLKEGGAQPLVALLEQAPPESTVVAGQVRARLTQPLAIGAIVSREPLDEASLDYLMPSLSIEGYATLLDVLASSRSRVTRRKLLDRLASTPLDVVPLVASRLADDRWYVQRNMLLLLSRVGRIPEGFQLTRWTAHADARLRAEAVRLQMSLRGQRELALRAAFSDPDPRVVRVGIAAVQQGCPPRVLPFLAGLAQVQQVPEDLRLLAVQSLGNTRDQGALDALVGLVDGGRTMFGRQKLAPKSAVVVAALRALAGAWRKHPKAEPLIGLAAVANDDELREAVR